MKQKNVRSEILTFFVFEGKRPPSQPGMMIKAEKKENGLTDPITGGILKETEQGRVRNSKLSAMRFLFSWQYREANNRDCL